tara:strand:+ start:1008 stop:1421 length:414 start_codon:yes stop_codon:yes gene_type:complete
LKKILLTIIDLVVKLWSAVNSPVASGTVSLLVATIIGYLININFGSDITLLVGILTGFVGLNFSNVYIKNKSSKDPKEVVIDEFSGKIIATSATGLSPLFNVFAFILFRTFAILKPGVISKAEKLDGAISWQVYFQQ